MTRRKTHQENRAALRRISAHQKHRHQGTTTDRDLPDYERVVTAITDLGYTPVQAREAATRYFEAANETAGGPNPDYFINMVRVAGLAPPPDQD